MKTKKEIIERYFNLPEKENTRNNMIYEMGFQKALLWVLSTDDDQLRRYVEKQKKIEEKRLLGCLHCGKKTQRKEFFRLWKSSALHVGEFGFCSVDCKQKWESQPKNKYCEKCKLPARFSPTGSCYDCFGCGILEQFCKCKEEKND